MVEKEAKQNDSSYSTISFIFGVLSVLVFLQTLVAVLSPVVGLILAILGFIFGIIQVKRGKTKLAVAGIVLSSIGLLINGLIVIKILSTLMGFLEQCSLYGGCENMLKAMAEQQAQSQIASATAGLG